jgi:hypothetical protein
MQNPISMFRGLSSGWKLFFSLAISAALFVVSWKLGSREGMLLAAANPVTNLTLADIVRQEAPNGGLLPIIESLSKLTPALQTITWTAANNGTYHRMNRRTALPAPIRRRINKGVPATVSGTQQVDEVTTMLADKSVIDATLIRMNGPESRAREVAAHMMGLEQQVESDLLVGSIGTDPDGIDGLETRLSATTNVPGGNQVVKVDAAPAGSDQFSVLLVGFADHGVHGIYPSGPDMVAGVLHKDYGEVSNGGSDGTNTFPAFVDYFEWHHGLAVEDFRYVARAANIDSSAILATGNNLLGAMRTLRHRVLIEDQSAKWAYFIPRFGAEMLDNQAVNATGNSTLSIDNISGKPIQTFGGIPVYTADLLSIAESIVA